MESSLKRVRATPNKKWSNQDVCKIIKYIKESPQFEHPTSQVYYAKLIQKEGIDAGWKLIRAKVRNLRVAFSKANKLRKSIDAVSNEDIGDIEKKVNKVCPYYNMLETIFTEKFGETSTSSSTSTTTSDQVFETYIVEKEVDNSQYMLDDDDDDGSSVLEQNLMESNLASSTNSQQSNKAFFKPKKVPLQDPIGPPLLVPQSQAISSALTSLVGEGAHELTNKIAQLLSTQVERNALEKRKLEFEQQKFAKEQELLNKQLKLEEEKFKAKQQWKMQELELMKLEIEKKSHVALFEIEMKYKNK